MFKNIVHFKACFGKSGQNFNHFMKFLNLTELFFKLLPNIWALSGYDFFETAYGHGSLIIWKWQPGTSICNNTLTAPPQTKSKILIFCLMSSPLGTDKCINICCKFLLLILGQIRFTEFNRV